MNKGTTGIVFFKDYFDYMDDLSPEQYYQFMGLIRDLRFEGKDVKPEEVEDKSVRLAWRSVRPSILKSSTNAKRYQKEEVTTNLPIAETREEPEMVPVKTNSSSGITGNYEEDIKSAINLYKSKDWWYDHHLNDMCLKYRINYKELKQLVEG